MKYHADRLIGCLRLFALGSNERECEIKGQPFGVMNGIQHRALHSKKQNTAQPFGGPVVRG